MPGTGDKEPRNVYQLYLYPAASWTNPLNLRVDDNQYAECNVPKTGAADPLDAINFKITPDDMPVGSTIVGIYVTIRRYAAAANMIHDDALHLLRNTATFGDNKASGELWPTDETLKAYGGPTDLWGSTDLTDDEIRDRDIGLRLRIWNDGENDEYAYIDAITMQIYYTPPEPTPDPTAVNLSKHIRVP